MDTSLDYQRTGAAPATGLIPCSRRRWDTSPITAALFALGAYLGRNLIGGAGIIAFIAAFACLIGMRFAAAKPQAGRRSGCWPPSAC